MSQWCCNTVVLCPLRLSRPALAGPLILLPDRPRLIDDSTPVSQSRHTLRFQPIACRSIMRCPRVLTRPEMVWQAFVPHIASGQLAVFDIRQKKERKKQQQENGIVAMASVSQTNDTLSNVHWGHVSHSSRFRSQKQGWTIVKLGVKAVVDPMIN